MKDSTSVTMVTSHPATALLGHHTSCFMRAKREHKELDKGVKEDEQEKSTKLEKEKKRLREGESGGCCSSSVLLESTFFTAIFICYVGSSVTASQFRCRPTSDFKQYFDVE